MASRAATGIPTRPQRDHGDMGTSMDQPAAALIKDLKQRGMLEDTLVILDHRVWPDALQPGTLGRDHNPFTFTSWLAGGGVSGGVTYGTSDEWSFHAVEHPPTATTCTPPFLHLLGIDHTRLTLRHNGIDRRLTDVHGHVIDDIIA